MNLRCYRRLIGCPMGHPSGKPLVLPGSSCQVGELSRVLPQGSSSQSHGPACRCFSSQRRQHSWHTRVRLLHAARPHCRQAVQLKLPTERRLGRAGAPGWAARHRGAACSLDGALLLAGKLLQGCSSP